MKSEEGGGETGEEEWGDLLLDGEDLIMTPVEFAGFADRERGAPTKQKKRKRNKRKRRSRRRRRKGVVENVEDKLLLLGFLWGQFKNLKARATVSQIYREREKGKIKSIYII